MSSLIDRRKLMMNVMNVSNIGSLTPADNFLNLIYHIEHKDYVSGEFVQDDWLPNEKTLIFDTGLSEIKGLALFDKDYDGSKGTEYTAYTFFFNSENPNGFMVNASQAATFDTKPRITRGTAEIEKGKFYVTANINKHALYTPLYKGHRYIWIAW